ncbi:MAG: hypothetical protein EPO39_09765 [Candidatus Manganitrophaceae bacterium]|nr:MAG: hypothetical protein EPO39_09765 [Candidatus Manganitrophaceae bacterium]
MKRLNKKTILPILAALLLISGWMTGQASAQAHRVTVATSGGDYTTVSAALAAISPSSSNPYVIDVMPGSYSDSPTMKSYVHLRGAGREVTTLTGTIAISNNATNVAVSGLLIDGSAGSYGIYIDNFQTASTVRISESKVKGYRGIFIGAGGDTVEITGNIVDATYFGIDVYSGTPKIRGNTIKGSQAGIYVHGGSGTLISGNKITNGNYGIDISANGTTVIDNTISGASVSGIVANYPDSTVTIIGNTITGNGNGGWAGIQLWGASPMILHNRITGNTPYDVAVDSSSTPNISFNIYDTISGTTGSGLYNVKSDGTAATNP